MARRAYGSTPVICLHASASSGAQWNALAGALGAGRRVHAPGLIGYRDGAPWDGRSRVTLDVEARALEPLLARAPRGAHLVGHSFGAAVALRLALLHPRAVRSLALYEPVLFSVLRDEPSCAAELREVLSVRTAVRRAVYSGRARSAAQSFVEYWSGAPAWAGLEPARREALAGRMNKVDTEFDAALYDATPLAAHLDLETPVLLVTGERTRRPTRRIVERLAAVLPRHEYCELAGAGHRGPLTHAGALNARIAALLEACEQPLDLARAA